MAFVAVARLQDVPSGRGLRACVDGVEIGIFRVGNALHAIENRCPHAAAPLSEGCLEGAIVTCTLHGWRFDVRTGFRPEDADGFPIPCFAVRTRGDRIEVDIDQVLNAPPRRLR